MAFGQVDPEKIIGMKPDELRAKLDSSATKEDLKGFADAQQALGQSISEIRDALKALTTRPPDPEPEPDPTDPTTAVLTDPAGYISKQTKGISDTALRAQADVNEMRARQNPQLRGAFEQFGDELVASAEKMYTLQQRASKDFWQYHVRTVLGEKVITGKMKGDYPSLAGSSSYAPGEPDANDPNKGMNPDMADFYKQRKVPLDQAKKIMELMNNGERISMATVKGGNA